MRADVISDVGLVRENNEDSYLFLPPNLFAVADGMGGHVAGEVASKQAVSVIAECFGQSSAEDITHSSILEKSIKQANQAIYAMAQQNKQYSGMGTTITAVYVNSDSIYWSHVGDSRLYLLKQGCLTQLTNDHSLVWELMQSGNISREEAQNHPKRNILTRAIGAADDVVVDTGEAKWCVGDSLLLCTDGLFGMVSEKVICNILSNPMFSPQIALEQLLIKAKEGGGLDNITAIIVRNEEQDD